MNSSTRAWCFNACKFQQLPSSWRPPDEYVYNNFKANILTFRQSPFHAKTLNVCREMSVHACRLYDTYCINKFCFIDCKLGILASFSPICIILFHSFLFSLCLSWIPDFSFVFPYTNMLCAS